MALTQVQDGMLGYDGGSFANRNRIINGDMRIDQRNAGGSVALSTGTFLTDRWNMYLSYSTMTGQRSTIVPNGFINSLAITVASGTSASSTDQSMLRQKIEGFNIADLGWGTVNAKAATLSFWVRSSLTGTFGVTIRNNTSPNRAYTAAYTISSANTFEYKTIVISGDTTGTWLTDNNGGIQVAYDLGSGTTYSQAAGSWTSNTSISGLTGGVKLAENTGATFYITGVQLEAGSVATPFEHRQFGQELALCQRYYQVSGGASSYPRILMPAYTTGAYVGGSFPFIVSMRATPTGTIVGTWVNQNTTVGSNTINVSPEGFTLYTVSGSTTVIAGLYPSSTGFLTLSAEL